MADLFDIGSLFGGSSGGISNAGAGAFPWKTGTGAAPPGVAPPSGFSKAMSSFSKAGGGSFASMLGAKGQGGGTQGIFTTIGSFAGPLGTLVGAITDIAVSSGMQEKSQQKARKQSRIYWQGALKELEQIKKGQAAERSGVLASMGASGASLASGSFMAYRAEQQLQQDTDYARAYGEFYNKYREIKKSGGKGGW